MLDVLANLWHYLQHDKVVMVKGWHVGQYLKELERRDEQKN
jgi:hypothetical protein